VVIALIAGLYRTRVHHRVVADGADGEEVVGSAGNYLDDFAKGKGFKGLLNV
jgi:hypothetical protein